MKTLAEIITLTEARKQGSGWRAKCKAHGGDQPDSLAIGEGTNGAILFRCWSNACPVEDILRAYGLEWADVLPEKELKQQPKVTRRREWVIRDIEGCEVATHVRFDESGGKRFIWFRGGKSGLGGIPATELPLYGSEKLKGLPKNSVIVVVEGERACDAAAKLGLLSVGTVCGASATPSTKALAPLGGQRVIYWPDNDAPGREHMLKIAEAVGGETRWISIPNAPPKADAADFKGTLEELKAFVSAEPPVERGPLVTIEAAVADVAKETSRILANDLTDFVSTGLSTLDRKLGGGLRRGQVVLLGAPSGSGKSSIIMQLAMAAQEKGTALVVSPEMSPQELVFREIVRRSGHPKWHLSQWASPTTRGIAATAHQLARERFMQEKPRVLLYDSMHVTIADVVTAARTSHAKSPLSFIALDYAQDLVDPKERKERHLAVGEVVRVGLELARELHVAIVVTSQLNALREGRRVAYTFRESASMEHKCHLALLFLVERDSRGDIESAVFHVRKARDIQWFSLAVDYAPELFSIRDKGERMKAPDNEPDMDPI